MSAYAFLGSAVYSSVLCIPETNVNSHVFSAARYAQELVLFMKEKNLSPFRNMLVPLAQVCML
jgi:hypothetical protein